ncbi:hypothetical protein BUALT_Bualt17G0068400 [Buddleja alternifolia]|uniref:Uncharacterized protein n=1 Tax=Buddleja alternifolia TaxID=168488 RepID=A0AAV6W6L6_9LAMI|nr:hypothetical protein BUALT_Bualt17G0068400 [Buddleja alternifolia]
MTPIHRLTSVLKNPNLRPSAAASAAVALRPFSTTRNKKTGDDEWNDAWETAWLPDDLSGKSSRAPWESDVVFSLPTTTAAENPPTSVASPPEEVDAETQAFVEDMNDNWDQRKGKSVKKEGNRNAGASETTSSSSSLYSLENIKRDYRVTKQKVHAALWVKEIEKLEEAKLGDSISGSDDIEKLLDSASDRRRPIDGWKYMIEEIGPNARKGKGSVSRLASVSDESTQPFREERASFVSDYSSPKGR